MVASSRNGKEYHPEALGLFVKKEFSAFGNLLFQYQKMGYKLLGSPGQAWKVPTKWLTCNMNVIRF